MGTHHARRQPEHVRLQLYYWDAIHRGSRPTVLFSSNHRRRWLIHSQRRLHQSNTEVADKQCAGLQTQVNVGALPTLRVGGKSFMNQKDRKEHFASFDQTVWMGEKSR